MRKNLALILILFTSMCFYGCNKNNNEKCPVCLAPIDINSLSNKKIIDIVDNNDLEEGIFKIKTKTNDYIFFYGKNIDYIDISTNLENNILIVSCNTTSSTSKNKYLYLIREQSTTSKNNSFYKNITLKINNKQISFNKIYSLP